MNFKSLVVNSDTDCQTMNNRSECSDTYVQSLRLTRKGGRRDLIKEYRQLRKPHCGDFDLDLFAITAKVPSSRKWSKVFLKAGSLEGV